MQHVCQFVLARPGMEEQPMARELDPEFQDSFLDNAIRNEGVTQPADINDIKQEVWRRFIAQLTAGKIDLTHPDAIQKYTTRIAQNLCVDGRRRANTRRRHEAEVRAGPPPLTLPHGTDAQEAASLLLAALLARDPPERQIILAHFGWDKSLKLDEFDPSDPWPNRYQAQMILEGFADNEHRGNYAATEKKLTAGDHSAATYAQVVHAVVGYAADVNRAMAAANRNVNRR
jgi:hypothetical protein